jgi:hypothetical protein
MADRQGTPLAVGYETKGCTKDRSWSRYKGGCDLPPPCALIIIIIIIIILL